MITHEVGLAHPVWAVAFMVLLACSGVIFLETAPKATTLPLRLVLAASVAVSLCGFAAAVDWAVRPAFVYDRCDGCENIVIGQEYSR